MLGSSLLGGGLAKVINQSEQLKQVTAQTEAIQEKIDNNLQRQAQNTAEINDLEKQRKQLQASISKNSKIQGQEKDKLKQKLGEVNQKLKSLKSSNRALVPLAKKYTKELNDAARAADKINAKLKLTSSLQRKLKQTGNFLSGKGANLRGALIAGGGGLAARSAFNAASLRESTQARVAVLENEFKQLIGLNEAAKESADKFILSQTQVLQDYINLGNRLGEQGASLQDLQNIYEGLNTVLVKNRATAQEAASATLQLSQALGAGRLQGEEFRAVNEAAPQVISEVSKVLKVTRGEVKQLAADGKVSSEVLLQALTNLRTNGADQLQAGFTGAFKATREFNKALTEFSETVGEELLPVITPLLEGASEILKEFGSWDKETRQLAVNSLLLGAALLVIAGPLTAIISGAGKLIFFLGGLSPLILGTAAATGKLALAIGGLKIALLALPFVAIGGALVALAVDMQRVNKEAELLNKRLKSDDLEDVKIATEELTQKKKELQAQLESLQGSSFYKGITDDINKLKGQIKDVDKLITEAVRRRQLIIDVKLMNDSVKKIKGFDTLTDAQIQEAFAIAGVDPDSKRTKSKSSGSKARESRVPQLKRDKELSLELLALNKQQLDAQLAENSALVETLEKKKIMAQLTKDIADVQANKELPAAEKLLEIDLLRAAAQGQLDGLQNQTAQRLKDEAKAREDALQSLRDERELLDAKLNGTEEAKVLEQQISEIRRNNKNLTQEEVEELVRGNAERRKAVELMEEQEQIIGQLVSGVGSELTGLFETLIEGTEDWNKELQNVLKSLSKILLNAGLNLIGSQNRGNLLGQLLGFQKRANGGPVSSGRPYIVGEKGPELFTPSMSGNITPNGALGGSTVVNITVNENGGSSSSSQGDRAKEALALGRLVESSVVAIINREKRPGGILTRA